MDNLTHLSWTFDTPPHELLKCKLYGYGIGGKTLKWIDSFLFQAAASCSNKWSKIRFGPCSVRCPSGHRSRTIVVLIVY